VGLRRGTAPVALRYGDFDFGYGRVADGWDCRTWKQKDPCRTWKQQSRSRQWYKLWYHSTVAINLKSPEAEALARKVSEVTGESLTGAILTALQERLDRLEKQSQTRFLVEQLDQIALRAASLPLLDGRTPDEIIGYDDTGLPR